MGHIELGLVGEARHQGIEVGIGLDLRRVTEQLLTPDQPRLLAQIDDLLEEAFEDIDAKQRGSAAWRGINLRSVPMGLRRLGRRVVRSR